MLELSECAHLALGAEEVEQIEAGIVTQRSSAAMEKGHKLASSRPVLASVSIESGALAPCLVDTHLAAPGEPPRLGLQYRCSNPRDWLRGHRISGPAAELAGEAHRSI
jgi:hypothetical protein